jgi:hypothetical protein
VTRRLGYEFNGTHRALSRGQPRDMLEFRLPRATWDARRRDDITIDGLQPCLALFGLSPSPASTAAEPAGS